MSQDEELHAMDAHRTEPGTEPGSEPGAEPDGDDHHDHDDEHPDAPPLADLPPTPVHGYWKSLRELDGQAAFLRNPDNITKMGYQPQPGEGEDIRIKNAVNPPTNCSTCHR